MTITIWLVAGQTTFLDLDQLKILVNVDYQSIPCLTVSRAVSRQSHGWEQIITVRAVRAVSRGREETESRIGTNNYRDVPVDKGNYKSHHLKF